MEFNAQTVKNNIDKCGKSIETFNVELEQQEKTIREYQKMIDDGNSQFPEESLKRGIESAKGKIVIINDAIGRERDTIKLLTNQIALNEKQVELEKEKMSRIEVIVE